MFQIDSAAPLSHPGSSGSLPNQYALPYPDPEAYQWSLQSSAVDLALQLVYQGPVKIILTTNHLVVPPQIHGENTIGDAHPAARGFSALHPVFSVREPDIMGVS